MNRSNKDKFKLEIPRENKAINKTENVYFFSEKFLKYCSLSFSQYIINGLNFQFPMAFAGLALLSNQKERRMENCLIFFWSAQSHEKMKTQPV